MSYEGRSLPSQMQKLYQDKKSERFEFCGIQMFSGTTLISKKQCCRRGKGRD